MKQAFALIFAIAFSVPLFAGCAEGSHYNACEGCFAKAAGRQAQQECFDLMSAEIIACYSEEYPMLVVASSESQCPEMNACLDASSACLISAGVASAEDICQNSGIAGCMQELDSCMHSADSVCGPRGDAIFRQKAVKSAEGICPCAALLAMAAGIALVFLRE